MPTDDCAQQRSTARSAAAELYQLAALMLGDDSQAAEVVEAAVARVETDPCADAEASFEAARLHLMETAVSRLNQADPQAFTAPALPVASSGCIEGDDLTLAGISTDQLAGMVNGPERGMLRGWLNKLSAVQRIVFIQRAILGWDNAAAATLLGRAASGNWQPGQVGEVFRQALCSLATSLVSSSQLKVAS